MNNSKLYRWRCYFKGALYAIRNKKKYDAVFIWQQMIGFIVFEIKSFVPFIKIPENIVFFTFIYSNDRSIFKIFKKRLVRHALHYSKEVIWSSLGMANEVKNDFPKYRFKNSVAITPIFDVIDPNGRINEFLDDPKFKNGVFSGGFSERDFNVVMKAFKNTDIPVTIVCSDSYSIDKNQLSSNIRILRSAMVNLDQFYALLNQAFCVVISLINKNSACGQTVIAYAMANSKPVIATDCFGVRDFIENNENGLLFRVGHSEEILKAYKKLKKDGTFADMLVKNARKTAGEMSLGHFIPRLTSTFDNILSVDKA
jgi:glycosyltransferase involved in cell wall biosynthesis